MPNVRRSKRSTNTSKKTIRRSTKTKSMPLKNMVNMGLGFPKSAMVKHRFADGIPVSIIAGALTQYRFRCNSMYDPNQTGIGNQPMLFDQYAGIYRHYVVVGSKITLKCFPTVANPAPTAIGIFINDDTTTTATNYINLSEQSTSTIKYMAYNNSVPLVITKTWSAKKAFAGSVLANNSLQGSDSANPTEEQFFNIYMQPVDGVTSLTMNIQVLIEYTAVWRELRDLAGS